MSEASDKKKLWKGLTSYLRSQSPKDCYDNRRTGPAFVLNWESSTLFKTLVKMFSKSGLSKNPVDVALYFAKGGFLPNKLLKLADAFIEAK